MMCLSKSQDGDITMMCRSKSQDNHFCDTPCERASLMLEQDDDMTMSLSKSQDEHVCTNDYQSVLTIL